MFHLAQVMQRAGSFFPACLAVVDGDIRMTYEQLARRTDQLAAALIQLGLSRGDRVAILDVNGFRYLEVNYACALAGLVLVPLNIRLASAEIAYIIKETDCKALLASDLFADVLRQLPAEATAGCAEIGWSAADGPYSDNCYERLLLNAPLNMRHAPLEQGAAAQIYFTSGTTGKPKGVCLTSDNLVASALDAMVALQISADDAWLHAAPMFHLVDAFAIWAVSLAGGTHVMARFNPSTFTALIAREKITKTSLPPTLINMIVNAPGTHCGPNSLKIISHGGSPMSAALHAQASSFFGCALLQAYGTTETSGITCQRLAADSAGLEGAALQQATSSIGRPAPSVKLKVVDADRVEVPHGQMGELAIGGPRVMTGYWKNPEATAEAIKDGWYFTGDLGYRDAAGLCYIIDRKKDMVITGGENVYPAEVEAALQSHPAVLEAAVFGIPSEAWGEEVRAVVVLRAEADCNERELIAHCRRLIGGYKVPKAIAISADPLPKSGPGKIAKHLVRHAYQAQARQSHR